MSWGSSRSRNTWGIWLDYGWLRQPQIIGKNTGDMKKPPFSLKFEGFIWSSPEKDASPCLSVSVSFPQLSPHHMPVPSHLQLYSIPVVCSRTFCDDMKFKPHSLNLVSSIAKANIQPSFFKSHSCLKYSVVPIFSQKDTPVCQ